MITATQPVNFSEKGITFFNEYSLLLILLLLFLLLSKFLFYYYYFL